MCDKELLLGVSQRKWLSLLSKDAINLRVRDFLEEEEAVMVVEESSAFLLFFFLFFTGSAWFASCELGSCWNNPTGRPPHVTRGFTFQQQGQRTVVGRG